MANRYAISSGNWSNPAIWDGGISVPTAGDIVRPNTFTVAIDQDITVLELRNDASAPALAGGSFSVVTNRTINGKVSVSNTAILLNYNAAITLNINGDVGNGSQTVVCVSTTNASSILNIVGNMNASNSNFGAHGVSLVGGAQLNVIGNVYGSNQNNNTINGASGSVTNLTGNIYGGAGGRGFDGGGTIYVNGNVYGGNTVPAMGQVVTNVNTVYVFGFIYGGSGAYGIQGNGILNGYCVAVGSSSAGGFPAIYGHSSSNYVIIKAIFTNTASPVNGKIKFANGIEQIDVINDLNNTVSLSTQTGLPAVTDVRNGVNYGTSSVGTLIVPTVDNVRKGVSTDNTVGTAELTAQDLFDAITSSSDPIAIRIRNVSTVQTTASTIASFDV
jgi:hypothetical protein